MIDNSTFATLTAEYHTLGCKLNFSETGTMAQLLAEQGVRRAHGGETPDIVVVNTCSVTEEADRKCRALLRRLRRRYADALIVATGCYAQRAGDEVAKLPGVGVVLGSDRKRDVVEAVAASKAKIAELEASKPVKEDPAAEIVVEPAAKKCPICGAESDSKFCPQCGAPMGE